MRTTKSSVIVYEIDKTVGTLLKELFLLHGHNAVTAGDLEELMNLLEERRDSVNGTAEVVIIADVKELYDIPRIYPEHTFILLSNKFGNEGRHNDRPFSFVVKKPFRFKELSKIVLEAGNGFDNRAVDRNTTGYGE